MISTGDMISVKGIEDTLRAVGLDLEDPNFDTTAMRWLKYLMSYCRPYDPKNDLGTTFEAKGEGTYGNAMIVQVGIPYHAVCAHHLLPVLGVAHVGYIPQAGVVGLSKLTRLVHGITHRMPSLQEDVCDEITEALFTHLKPLGSMCVISAEHGCMAARGVEAPTHQIRTVTASVKGVFIEDSAARKEFYDLIGLGTT